MFQFYYIILIVSFAMSHLQHNKKSLKAIDNPGNMCYTILKANGYISLMTQILICEWAIFLKMLRLHNLHNKIDWRIYGTK